MTIEGNWIKGALKYDYPNVKYEGRRAARRPRRQGHAVVHPVLRRRVGEQEPGRGHRPGQLPLDRRARARARQGPRRHARRSSRRGDGYKAAFPDDAGVPRRCGVRAGPGHRRRHGPGAQGLRHPARTACRAPTRRPCSPACRRTARPSSSKPRPAPAWRPAPIAGRHAAPLTSEGTTMRRGGSARARDPLGLALRHPGHHRPRAVPRRADRHRVLGQPQRLDRPRIPALRGGRTSSAPTTTDSCSAEDSLARSDFATSIRNNFYYVLLVVPIQTVLALGLALLLNQRRLKGLSFFRTAYYFPSVTSSVAIASVFLFLFAGGGSVNAPARPSSASTGRTGSPTRAVSCTSCSAPSGIGGGADGPGRRR